jgi:hypothetical protein
MIFFRSIGIRQGKVESHVVVQGQMVKVPMA